MAIFMEYSPLTGDIINHTKTIYLSGQITIFHLPEQFGHLQVIPLTEHVSSEATVRAL